MDHHSFEGSDIPHMDLGPDTTVSDLIEAFSKTGYNAKQLGRAAKIWAEMIENDATVCLTMSGAMAPVGYGGLVKTLIERGMIDWIVTTGANVYHEEHFAWGLPMRQGHFDVDDSVLFDKEIVRIRDVYIKFYETLEAQDQVVQKMFKDRFVDEPFTTAEFCNEIGKISSKFAPHPEKSFVVSAFEHGIPLYVSTLKDSSLALNLAVHRLRGKTYNLDIVREIIEQAAIVYGSAKSGIVELGGGVPKNTAQQTGPLLDQILRRGDGGQDYVIQVTDARPDTGGLSGATLQEGKSWGKIKDSKQGNATVYADATIAFPLMALYVMSSQKTRKPKRLYDKLGGMYDKLKDDYFSSEDKFYDMLNDSYDLKKVASSRPQG